MRGPIDYIVVGFEDAKFNGSVLSSLAEAIDSGVIALVDLAVVHRDEEGTVTALNIADMGDDYIVEFAQKYKSDDSSVDADDVNEVGELLDDGQAAGLLVIEQL